jgi:hypothetical protein
VQITAPERRRDDATVAPAHMLAIHAFSQFRRHPLLGTGVYNAETFSELRLQMIDQTSTWKPVVQRNVQPASPDFVNLARKDWRRN